MKNVDFLANLPVLLPSFTLFYRDSSILEYSIYQLLQSIYEHVLFRVAHCHCLDFSGSLVAKLLYKLVHHIINSGVLPEPNRFKSLSHMILVEVILLHNLLFFFVLVLKIWLMKVLSSNSWYF